MNWLSHVADCIPVVGTVKNTVESGVALVNGDYRKAARKAGSAAFGLLLDVTTAGAGHAAGFAAKSVGKKVAVAAIPEALVLSNIAFRSITHRPDYTDTSLFDSGGTFTESRGRRRSSTPVRYVSMPESEKKASEDKARANFAAVREIAQRAHYYQMRKEMRPENKRRSARGEHVINNDVLKAFRKIIQEFIHRFHKDFDDLLRPGTRVYEAYHSPLPEDITTAIQEELIAHIPDEEIYVDFNAILYGITIEFLSNKVVQYMMDYFCQEVKEGDEDTISELVNFMNTRQIYVDEIAKYYWLQRGGTLVRFEECRRKVDTMFKRLCALTADDVRQWVDELTSNL